MKVRAVANGWLIKEPRNGGVNERFPNDGRWTFNGDLDHPTFTPSLVIKLKGFELETVNHFIVTDGKIAYCPDCTHELAGQTLDLLDFSEAETLAASVAPAPTPFEEK